MEAENKHFEELVAARGAWAVWRAMRPLSIFRAYYQKYPLDDRRHIMSLERDGWMLGTQWREDTQHLPPHQATAANDWVAQFLNTLTPHQRHITIMLCQGYKPTNLAVLRQACKSADRYTKWVIKGKLQQFYIDNDLRLW